MARGRRCDARRFPFALRYFRQEAAGPGTARNLGIEQAAGELVLFIGDDILADERLLEEHLLAHAATPGSGAAVLGHIDWPATMPHERGDGVRLRRRDAAVRLHATFRRLPVARSPVLLHEQHLAEAAVPRRRGRRRRSLRSLLPPRRVRRLRVRVQADAARPANPLCRQRARGVTITGWISTAFAGREFGAGEMAVVFYRKHPGQDEQLQVRWLAELVEPRRRCWQQPDFLRHLEAFDRQTDTLLRRARRVARGADRHRAATRSPRRPACPATVFAPALHNVLRVVFDVQRTRGKLQEWFSMVEDPAKVHAAQTLASVMRKIEFLNANAGNLGSLPHPVPIDPHAVATLSGRIAAYRWDAGDGRCTGSWSAQTRTAAGAAAFPWNPVHFRPCGQSRSVHRGAPPIGGRDAWLNELSTRSPPDPKPGGMKMNPTLRALRSGWKRVSGRIGGVRNKTRNSAAKVASRWAGLASDTFVQDLERVSWTGIPQVHLNHNFLITGSRETYWIDWMRERFFPGGDAGDTLSLGCGAGHLDRIFKEHGFSFRSFTGIDISEEAIDRARTLARRDRPRLRRSATLPPI